MNHHWLEFDALPHRYCPEYYTHSPFHGRQRKLYGLPKYLAAHCLLSLMIGINRAEHGRL
ncbi:hypothetical protein [Xenorhabdus mauleonii]|uniref:hypothetical protein n=1 Tax=Xenorhabdus mauleonii TaxID=351675 RepID=UPI00111419D6|nr:hypothetical protein [Xenorhabdus mauleonii]